MTGLFINNLTTTIFQQLTFELTTPELYGIIGPNGIGKSTLTLQTILRMQNRDILYVSGEESAHQIKMRAERIGGNGSVQVLCETSLENIFDSIKEAKPELVIIDSIQMCFGLAALRQDERHSRHPHRPHQ